jgi:hypothetical protein
MDVNTAYGKLNSLVVHENNFLVDGNRDIAEILHASIDSVIDILERYVDIEELPTHGSHDLPILLFTHNCLRGTIYSLLNDVISLRDTFPNSDDYIGAKAYMGSESLFPNVAITLLWSGALTAVNLTETAASLSQTLATSAFTMLPLSHVLYTTYSYFKNKRVVAEVTENGTSQVDDYLIDLSRYYLYTTMLSNNDHPIKGVQKLYIESVGILGGVLQDTGVSNSFTQSLESEKNAWVSFTGESSECYKAIGTEAVKKCPHYGISAYPQFKTMVDGEPSFMELILSNTDVHNYRIFCGKLDQLLELYPPP